MLDPDKIRDRRERHHRDTFWCDYAEFMAILTAYVVILVLAAHRIADWMH